MYWRLLILTQKLKSHFFRFLLNYKGVKFNATPKFQGSLPRFNNIGTIILGEGCRFRALNASINISTTNVEAKITIGNNCFFNHGVNISASKSIEIGEDTRIGDNVIVFDSDFHCVEQQQKSPKTLPISIGRNVWIGANAIILAGSKIGDHSVIGAGAVVTGEVPLKVVFGGNPAKKIKNVVCDDNWVRF